VAEKVEIKMERRDFLVEDSKDKLFLNERLRQPCNIFFGRDELNECDGSRDINDAMIKKLIDASTYFSDFS